MGERMFLTLSAKGTGVLFWGEEVVGKHGTSFTACFLRPAVVGLVLSLLGI